MTNEPRDRAEISMDNNARIRELESQLKDLKVLFEKILQACEGHGKKTDDMYRRFLEPSPSGEPPLVDRINKAVALYERASWMGKFGLWTIMTLGGLAAASTQVMNWLRGTGKG